MAWYDTSLTMLRIIINDADTPYTYSDSRLQTVLAVAAMYVKQEIEFDTTYTVSVSTPSISPDPDDLFSNFIVLKGACIADFSTFRTKALMEGITARCGPATLQVLGHIKAFRDLITIGPCAAYAQLKNDYVMGNARICEAILSPFTGNNFDPESLDISVSNYYNRNDTEENYT